MTDTITLPRDLVEHCATELKHQCGGRCNAEYNPCWAIELSDKLRAALAQQAEQVSSGKTCSNCTFHYKDIDMKPCSNCERGDNIDDNGSPMSTGQIALAAAPKGGV